MSESPWIRLVRRQAGYATRRQLSAEGVNDNRIAAWKRQGLVVSVGDGVYRMTVVPASQHGILWRASLLSDGVLTGAAALVAWEILREAPSRPTAIVPLSRRRVPRSDVRLLRRDLAPDQVVSRHGLLVTTRAYSALEHIVALPFVDAVPFADRALAQGWLRESDVRARLGAKLDGNQAIRKTMAVVEKGIESEAERLMARLLRASGITGWKANKTLWYRQEFLGRVDFVFADAWLVLEINGFAYHRDRERFGSDMRRNNRFEFTPYMVLEFGWDDIVANPRTVIAQIRRALDKRLAA